MMHAFIYDKGKYLKYLRCIFQSSTQNFTFRKKINSIFRLVQVIENSKRFFFQLSHNFVLQV